MKPILFDEATTEFTTNGIGRLSDAFSCICTEERNGVYELEMVYPVSGAHYSDIIIRNIIVIKPSANASLQAFRIYKITKPINGKVSVFAQHLTYDLGKNTTMPFTVLASGTACAETLAGLKANAVEVCPFTFWTDVVTVAGYTQDVPSSIRQRLGGIEGSVLDQFGGEYEWDNWTVKLHDDRGVSRNITLRYGKNITDINQEENIANTAVGVVPFWISGERDVVVTLTEKVIYSSHAPQYSAQLVVPLDLSSKWEDPPTEEQLRNAARVHVNQSGFGVPNVSIKVSFVNLADTAEYADILPLENVDLCDIITVQFEPLGINTTAKVVKTVYDVLKEKYNSIEVGDLRSTLATTLYDSEMSTFQRIADTFAKTGSMIDNATAWLTSAGGYVVAVKNEDGSWKELLFMDDDDPAEAINVLRINTNGIGFSTNGIDGPYRNAWTIDGNLIADFIHGGTLTLGGNNNVNGVITMKDANGNTIGTWDCTGLEVAKGSMRGLSMDLGGPLGDQSYGQLRLYDTSGQEFAVFNQDGILCKSGDMRVGYKGILVTDLEYGDNWSTYNTSGHDWLEIKDDGIMFYRYNKTYSGDRRGGINLTSSGYLNLAVSNTRGLAINGTATKSSGSYIKSLSSYDSSFISSISENYSSAYGLISNLDIWLSGNYVYWNCSVTDIIYVSSVSWSSSYALTSINWSTGSITQGLITD